MMNMKRHIQLQCERAGVLIHYTPKTLMLVPAYTMADEDVDLLGGTVAKVLNAFDPDEVDPATLRPPTARGHR